VSLTGDWALITAIPLFVYQVTGSTLALGVVGIVDYAPRFLIGSVAGVFVDRWDRRKIMLVANVALGLSLLPLVLVVSAQQFWVLLLVVVVESVIAPFYRSAQGAMVPRLVSHDELVSANALNTLSVNFARLAGPAVGALLLTFTGLLGVVLVDVISFLLAALTVLLIQFIGDETRVQSDRKRPLAALWREWLDGLQLVRDVRTARVLFTFVAVTGVGDGIFLTLWVAFVERVLKGGELSYGVLLTTQAAGGIVGSLALGRFGRRLAPAQVLGAGACLIGLIDLIMFYVAPSTHSDFVPLLLMSLVGFPIAAVITGFATLSQTAVGDAYLGRLLGLVFATTALTGVLGRSSAVMGDAIGVVPLLTVHAVAYIGAGSFVLLVLRVPEQG
jgi:Na+/melibiose symporter-like transporter